MGLLMKVIVLTASFSLRSRCSFQAGCPASNLSQLANVKKPFLKLIFSDLSRLLIPRCHKKEEDRLERDGKKKIEDGGGQGDKGRKLCAMFQNVCPDPIRSPRHPHHCVLGRFSSKLFHLAISPLKNEKIPQSIAVLTSNFARGSPQRMRSRTSEKGIVGMELRGSYARFASLLARFSRP